MAAEPLLLVALRAFLARLLRLRRTPLDQPDGREDVEEELQVLRLPVLHHVHAERRGRHVLPQRHRLEAVGHLLGVEVSCARERLPHQRDDEQSAEHKAQRVVAEEAPGLLGHRPISPRAVTYAMPTTSTTRYATNTARVPFIPPPRSRTARRPAPGRPRR